MIERSDIETGEAQYCLAVAYHELPRCIVFDRKLAGALYEKSANLGHMMAQYRLGRLYCAETDPQDFELNYEKGVKWLLKAAEQGCVYAPEELCNWYDWGEGDTEKKVQACKWYKIAEKIAGLPENIPDLQKEVDTATIADLKKTLSPNEIDEAETQATDWIENIMRIEPYLPNFENLEMSDKKNKPTSKPTRTLKGPRRKKNKTAQQNLEEFVFSVYRETRNQWGKVKKQIPEIGERGYQILNGPPILNPPIFFLSLNPGFSQATQDSPGWDPSPKKWPDQFGYLENPSKFSIQFRQIFVESTRLGHLIDPKLCNACYTMFFRSKDWKEWKSFWKEKPDERVSIEENCLEKVHELIDLSQPKLIITFGKDVFKKTATKKIEELNRPWGGGSIALFRLGEHNGIKVIGLPHISGTYLSSEHIKEIPEFIANELKQL